MQQTIDLIEQIKSDHSLLHSLSARQFEQVIAELLAGFGWEVSLPRGNRDDGYDIIAIKRDVSGLESSFIFNCKKYMPHNKVGVEPLRLLYFLRSHLRVGHAALITSSSFTRGAAELSRQLTAEIQLVDGERLIGWISKYVRSPANLSYLPERRFSSCFISYSHKNEEFVNLLAGRLRQSGVRVWHAPKDLRAGKKMSEEIFKAIENFDKLLLVLSAESMKSNWVKSEIRRAKRRETRDRKRLLFPVSIVSFEEVRDWEYFDADTGMDLAAELREFLIPDFSDWRDLGSFEKKFAALLEGLEASEDSV